MHLDNLVSGGRNVNEIENLKQKSIEFISKRSFNSNKWKDSIAGEKNILTLTNCKKYISRSQVRAKQI